MQKSLKLNLQLPHYLVIANLYRAKMASNCQTQVKQENSYLSVKRAAELTHNMYQLNFMLPESKHQKSMLLRMNQEQADLYQIILKYY